MARNCGDTFQATAASNAAAHNVTIAARHRKCSSANTAIMIGIVTSAVRETTSNLMLISKLAAMAANSAASPVLFIRSSVMTG